MSELQTQTYAYRGPVQSVALQHENADGEMVVIFEDTLYPNKDYLLPVGHKIVDGWKAMDLIEEVN